jgi:hypothetical protein
MFELTINGKTEKFETVAEMVAWRERMQKPRFKKRNKKKKKKPKISKGLTDKL